MLRVTVIVIEFCSLLDEGTIANERFPDVEANFAFETFRGYCNEALADSDLYPSPDGGDEPRVELLPCPN